MRERWEEGRGGREGEEGGRGGREGGRERWEEGRVGGEEETGEREGEVRGPIYYKILTCGTKTTYLPTYINLIHLTDLHLSTYL